MSTRELFHRLVDDAAIFPPGNAPLADAVRDHHDHRRSAYASLVGPLLVRDIDVSAVPEATEQPLDLGIIVTSGIDGLEDALVRARDSAQLGVAAVEIPVPSDAHLPLATKELVRSLTSVVPIGVIVSVELPRPGAEIPAVWIEAADEIRSAGFQTKFRTGGVVAAAHPLENEVAVVLGALIDGGHRIKFTAGLHRAVRNTQLGTGFEQHGFLNIMIAVHTLLAGASAADAAEVLRDRDGQRLAAVVQSWSDDDVTHVRRTFAGFGSCSVIEPFTDLVDLGLVSA